MKNKKHELYRALGKFIKLIKNSEDFKISKARHPEWLFDRICGFEISSMKFKMSVPEYFTDKDYRNGPTDYKEIVISVLTVLRKEIKSIENVEHFSKTGLLYDILEKFTIDGYEISIEKEEISK